MNQTANILSSAIARSPSRVVADGRSRELEAIRRHVRFGVLRRYARKPRPTGWFARWRWSRQIERDVSQAMAALKNYPPHDALYSAKVNNLNSGKPRTP